jgi:shikimate dehydrogenase
VIANRTAERAVALAAEFADLGPVSGCEFAKLEHHRFDLIVNATSASLRGDVPASRSTWWTSGHLLRHGLRRR